MTALGGNMDESSADEPRAGEGCEAAPENCSIQFLEGGFDILVITRSSEHVPECLGFVLAMATIGLAGIKELGHRPNPVALVLCIVLFMVLPMLYVGPWLLMAFFGRVHVHVESGGLGTVFVGAGSLGWNKFFRFDAVTAVKEVPGPFLRLTRGRKVIQVEGEDPFRFGSMLTEEQRRFMLKALEQMLAEREAA